MISHPGAVEHPRGLRAERAVHERLHVADPQRAGRRSRCECRGRELVEPRRPGATARRAASARLASRRCEQLGRAEPAVLVVHGRDAARRRPPAAPRASRRRARRRRSRSARSLEVPAPTPRAGRPSARRASSRSTTPPGDLEVAARASERRRVEPERVAVPREQRDRRVAARRRRAPPCVGSTAGDQSPLAPAAPAQPAAAGARADASRTRRERLVERGAPLEPHLAAGRAAQVGKCTWASMKPGNDAAAAEVDPLGRRPAPSRASPTPPAIRSPAIASARATGSDGSSVRMTPFSRITLTVIVRRRMMARWPERRSSTT